MTFHVTVTSYFCKKKRQTKTERATQTSVILKFNYLVGNNFYYRTSVHFGGKFSSFEYSLYKLRY